MALPIANGVQLVSVSSLPQKFQNLFDFPFFNAIQSRSFDALYRTTDNFVLSSPTGSGKTVIFELALCKLIIERPSLSFKVVYIAPMKSLCAERLRDWNTRFRKLGLCCTEFTGDTDRLPLSRIQSAHVIITTPEKWDNSTRRWKDLTDIMRSVRLILVDEVHHLKDDRGASLEMIISRIKSSCSEVRFVALSATIPNPGDVATWLGKNSRTPSLPAHCEVFDESFRPVQLERHVYGYSCQNPNVFAFEQILQSNLFSLLQLHSKGRPILIFNVTQRVAVDTAKSLANTWAQTQEDDRPWTAPSKPLNLQDPILRECSIYGVAYHHAGLEAGDRLAVECAFRDRVLKLICCTSTLAVGVNLPAHLVIIKNTVSWQTETSTAAELSEMETLQMLGRAGRPQYDRSGTAVIMTRHEQVSRYQNLGSSREPLESRLHLKLLEHMNAEISLRTIRDDKSSQRWFESTFLCVRLRKNADYYKLGEMEPGKGTDHDTKGICHGVLQKLAAKDLVEFNKVIQSTPQGEAMAKYAIKFETMDTFAGISSNARVSEILSAVAQAAEYANLRLRQAESGLYQALNNNPLVKFRIPVSIAMYGHKVSLILQSILGGFDPRNDKEHKGQMKQFNHDSHVVFTYAHRLICCIIDCEVAKGHAIATHNAMLLSRSIGAKAWDNEPMQLAQLSNIGPVACRKLSNAGIKTIDDLLQAESHQIEMAVGRNCPFGRNILTEAQCFPQLRVSLKMARKQVKDIQGNSVCVRLDAEVAFMNRTTPTHFMGKEMMVCFLSGSTKGKLAHFRRAKHINSEGRISFDAHIEDSNEVVNCYVSCDDVAGSERHASVHPKVPAALFKEIQNKSRMSQGMRSPNEHLSNFGPRSTANDGEKGSISFEDDDLLDDEILEVIEDSSSFVDIEQVEASLGEKAAASSTKPSLEAMRREQKILPYEEETWRPIRLPNGKWACNHHCKDKNICKHVCCNEGLDKKPAKPRSKRPQASDDHAIRAKGLSSTSRASRSPEPDDSSSLVPMNLVSKSSDKESQSRASFGSSHKPRENHERAFPVAGSSSLKSVNFDEIDPAANDWFVTSSTHHPAKRILGSQQALGLPEAKKSKLVDQLNHHDRPQNIANEPGDDSFDSLESDELEDLADAVYRQHDEREPGENTAPHNALPTPTSEGGSIPDPQLTKVGDSRSDPLLIDVGNSMPDPPPQRSADPSVDELQELATWLHDNFGDVAELVHDGHVINAAPI